MKLSAGEAATGTGGSRCTQCQKPFAFVVAYCPFCGSLQQALSPPASQEPKAAAQSPPRPRFPASVSPDPAFLPGAARPSHIAPREAGPQPARAANPRLPTWFWGVALVLFMLAIKGLPLPTRQGPGATVTVSARPDVAGEVLIDGARAGHAGESLRVTAGMHSLGFAAAGWLAVPRRVSLQANQQRAISLPLTPLPAILVIRPDPPDTVLRLDNRVIHASRGELSVPAGRHRLTATHPGYVPLALDLPLERGERKVVSISLVRLVVRVLALQAPVGSWSEPVTLPARTSFTLALNGRIRLRIGQEVYLVTPGRSINLGDVRGASLQIKAVDDQPVDVHLFLKPER